MSKVTERLKARLESPESVESEKELLRETLQEMSELREQRDRMEEILILLVRTGLPWDESGQTDEHFEHFRTRYAQAMREASQLLGLDLRSTITRTEPRT